MKPPSGNDQDRARDGDDDRIAFALASAHIGVWEWNAATNDACWSPSWYEITGLPSFGGTFRAFLAVVHDEDRARVGAAFDHAITARAPLEVEFRIVRPDGTVRWLLDSARWKADETGEPTRLIGVIQDVTDTHRTAQLLREREVSYRQLVELSPDTIFINGGGRIVFINAAGVALLGAESPAELLGRPPLDFLHPDFHAVARERQALALEGGKALPPTELKVVRLDGTVVPVESVASRVEYEGQPAVQVIVRDITQRKQAENALRTSRAQLMAALDAGAMGSWTWDVAKDLIDGDPAVRALWGFAPNDRTPVTPLEIWNRIHADDRERIAAWLDGLRQGGMKSTEEYRLQLPDGSQRWIVTHALLERDADGRSLQLAGVHVDVTDRKRAEEALLRSQKLEALGTLSGGIAHDFNNILAAITGNAELALLSLPDGHPVAEYVTEISRASRRAITLVRQILSFSRPQPEGSREVVALGPIVEEAHRLVRATLPAMIEIDCHVELNLPLVSADTTQVLQAIVNLATNAAHAIGRRSGRIRLRLESVDLGGDEPAAHADLRAGRWVRLTVADDGDGMDAATIERIFDPFFTTKPVGEGTGLGLSMVHGIARRHDGAITVRSRPGAGSTFELWLPAVARHTAQPEPPAPEPAARGHGRVLFVDDEVAIVNLARRTLESLGYEVAGFRDPVAAQAAFLDDPNGFDFVITDAAMPVVSGLELARTVRGVRGDLPILMTSGHLGPDAEASAREAGVWEVLPKPFQLRELGAALERLRRKRP